MKADTGGLRIQNFLGVNYKVLNVTGVTGEKWNNRKKAPKPLTRIADFIREKTPTPRTSKL